MNDSEAKATEERIVFVLDRWLSLLGLDTYKLLITYDRSYSEDNSDEAAKIKVSWEYMQASLVFFLPIILEQNDEQLEGIIVHELCHILLAPVMHEDTNLQLREFTTETVSRTLLSLKSKTPNN